MPGPHQILPGGFAGAYQITSGFLRWSRYPHRHHLVQPQQPRHVQGVTGIGFHPITTRTLQLRRRCDLTTNTAPDNARASPNRSDLPHKPQLPAAADR